MKYVIIAVLAFVSACASGGGTSFDLANMQRRLDDRGMGFGISRVPGHDAFVLQVRFRTSDAGEEAPADPMAAAQAAAPEGCTVGSLEPEPDGASYRVEYAC